MSGTRSASPKAPATDSRLTRASLLICGYGGGPRLARRVTSLRRRARLGEAAACGLFGDPLLEDAIGSLSGKPILVVPFLMAAGVTHGELRERLERLRASGPLVLCPAVGSHPDLGAAVFEHARDETLGRGWALDETAVLLIGHGSRRNDASRRSVERLAAAIEARPGFAETATAFLEETPSIEEAVAGLSAERLLAVGCFIEPGRHAMVDVPRGLAASRRPTAYGGPIGESPWIDRLILEQALRGAGSEAGDALH